MAATSDMYSATQAAQILGISERRVRQLVAQGALPGERTPEGTVRIPQRAVNEERKRRRKLAASAPARGRAGGRRSTAQAEERAAVDVDSLAEAVASAIGQRLEGQLEITRRAESLVRQELDEERARRLHAEAQLEAARERLAELEQAQMAAAARRSFFRRRSS